MQRRFNVLDSFRGLAALFVVVYHMHFVGSVTELEFFRGSHLFVEFFFILSGFVLVHGYAFKENLQFENFFISRTFRILPLHVFMLLVFIVLEFGKLFAHKYGFNFNTEPFTADYAVAEIVPNLFLLQSWLPNTMGLSWNSPSWSISIEYYMYMILYATLLIKSNLRYLLWFTISLVMFGFIFMGTEVATQILRGLSCFFAGGLTYLVYRNVHHKINFNAWVFTFLEVFILAVVVLIVSSNIEHKSLVLSFLFAVQVFIFAFEKGIVSLFLTQKLFLYFGKLSYSIYMVHAAILFISLSVIMVLQKVLGLDLTLMLNERRYVDIGSDFYNNVLVFCILAVIVFISKFTYKYIEVSGQSKGKEVLFKLANKHKEGKKQRLMDQINK